MLSALISLEATVDDGNNYNSTYLRGGDVKVSNLTCYAHNGGCPSRVTKQALAHAYGEAALSSDCGAYEAVADIAVSKQDHGYFCRNDWQEFSYRFSEYNPNDTQKAYPHFTNRTFTASSGQCLVYDQVGKGVAATVGDMSACKFTYNGSTSGTITIPTANLGREGTTYTYQGMHPPASASREACGPRCLWMWVYKNPGATEGPKIYRCPVTVSVVNNARQHEHHIPDAVARLAVASIALEGQFQGSRNGPIFKQFQFYASG